MPSKMFDGVRNAAGIDAIKGKGGQHSALVHLTGLNSNLISHRVTKIFYGTR